MSLPLKVPFVLVTGDLESVHKKRRKDLEERLKSVAEGRGEYEHKKKGKMTMYM